MNLSENIAMPVFGVIGQLDDEQATCVLALPGAAGNAVARLVVGLNEHTQSVLYRLAKENKLYEPHTTMLALGALRPGDIAFDIGAHVGYFATLFRLAVGSEGRIFAFEPLAETYRRLLHNVVINDFANVLPLPLAVARRVGTANLYVSSKNEGESSLMHAVGDEALPVQVTSLDSLFREDMTARPRLMKIDVEGAELEALFGAVNYFERQGPDLVIIEINRDALAHAGATEWDIRQFFESRGYRAGAINGTMGEKQGVGSTLFRYYDDAYRHVPFDFPYVFNEIYVRNGSGLYPEAV